MDRHHRIGRVSAALAAGTALAIGMADPIWAAPSNGDQLKQEAASGRQEMLRARLAKMSERLEIKASQQAAWQAFANAMSAMAIHDIKRPQANADAAIIARFRADLAAERAQKLAQVADTTARLRSVLLPDQRATLDAMAHNFRHGGHHGMHGRNG